MSSFENRGKNTASMRNHKMKQKSQLAGKIEEYDLGATDVFLFGSSVALNAAEPNKLPLVIRPNPSNYYLTSDPQVDEQLMLKLAFRDPVTLTHILVRADCGPDKDALNKTMPSSALASSAQKDEKEDDNADNDANVAETKSDAEEEEEESEEDSDEEESDSDDDELSASGPRMIKIFANKPELDFTDAADIPASQQMVLDKKSLNGSKIPLKSLKFQRVSSIQLFIVDNQSDTNVTFLNRVGLIGRLSQAYHTDFGN